MFTLLETPADLAPWVRCIWTLRDAGSAAAPLAPDGCCEWIIHLGETPLAWRDGEWRRQPSCFVYGQLQAPLHLHADRGMQVLAVRLQPHAAAALLRISGAALMPEPMRLTAPAAARAALSRLADRPTPARAYRDVIAVLRALAADARPVDSLIRRATAMLDCSLGVLRIDTLARNVGVSRRTLERRFHAEVGLGPKRYARIQRMQQSLQRLASGRHGIAAVAHELGYADQAHLTRELRSLAGCVPSAVGQLIPCAP